MLMCIQNLVGFCQYVLKILSGNEILTSIKGRNSVKILRKMTGNNPKLDLVNVDVHTKLGRILSIRSHDIERKRNPDVNQGGPRGRVVKVADFSALNHSIISPLWVRASLGARVTCGTSQVLLAGVSGGFSPGTPVFAPPTD